MALQVQAAYYLGLTYHLMGDYQQAAVVLGDSVASLKGQLIQTRFGLPYLPAVFSRTWLVWCLAELGTFAEGMVHAETGVRLAEAVDQPWDLLAAYRGVGLLYLGQGELQRAISFLERCLVLCRTWDISGWFAVIAAQLGYAYALAGRINEALPLLEQAVTLPPTKQSVYHARLLAYLGEVHLLNGRLAEALPLGVHALELSRQRKQRGFEAYALRLLGEIHTIWHPQHTEPATDFYQQALLLANELGMCPLQAHCHRGLGTLYRQTGQAEQARAELSTAIEMYRDMEMTFWLPETETALAEVEGR